MRNCLIIIIIILFPNLFYSQNWSCIKADAITYFSKDTTCIHAIRIDSVENYLDSTVLRSFNMIRPLDNGSFTLKGDSWIGEKVVEKNDGWTKFFNFKHEPMLINTRCQLNDSWYFYNYPTGAYIEAKVISTGMATILGYSDSVKTIRLQLKDVNGNNINSTSQYDSAYIINSIVLRLSKNLGLVSLTDFYTFPYFSSSQIMNYDFYCTSPVYNLVGTSNPQLGYQNITAFDIFDFEVGDEIDISEGEFGGYMSTSDYEKRYVKKYIGKVQTPDSVYYTIDQCYEYILYTQAQTDSSFSHDTIVEIYTSASEGMNKLPLEPTIRCGFNTFFFSSLQENYYSDSYIFSNYLSSDTTDMIMADPGFDYYFYTGLGGPYYSGTGMMGEQIQCSIHYYKKGNTEWGTPYNICDYSGIKENRIRRIHIFPNPFSENIIIDTDEHINKVELYNIAGELLFKGKGKYLNITGINQGTYMLRVITPNTVYSEKIIKD